MISSEFPPGPGGIGNHAHNLALNLFRLGWEIAVVSPQAYASGKEIEEFNRAQPINVTRVPTGRGGLREASCRTRIAFRLACKQRPDVLLGTGRSGAWIASAIGAVRRIPAVAVAHGSEFGIREGIPGALNRWAFERANAVVAVSNFTREIVQKAGIRARRIEVIPNAANHLRFVLLHESECEAFREKMGFNGAPILLTVGRVSERKGQEVVIRALPHILRKVPQAHYLMIGLPSLKQELTMLAQNLGVGDRIHFLDRVAEQELVRWVNCCDVFLMTSRTISDGDCEGFGIAVIEAALCGKPAVVSGQSGLTEAIQAGTTGIAVPQGDEIATAEAVISLLVTPSRRQSMGEAARQRALEQQTWPSCSQRYDALLREIARKTTYRSVRLIAPPKCAS